MADKGRTLTDRLIEGLATDITNIGESYIGTCDSGMAASTITIVCDDLKDFGDDYFNDGWLMYIDHNDDAPGTAPEGETQDITDYVSVSGTFTTAAFSANVEENDVIIVSRVTSFIIDQVKLTVSPLDGSLASFISSGNGSTSYGSRIGTDKSIVDAIGHSGVARLDSGIDGILADGLLNGTGTILPDNKSIYDELGGSDSNSYPIASNTKFIKSVALTGEVSYSVGDILKVSDTEKIKNFIAKTGGTEVPASKSLIDILGAQYIDAGGNPDVDTIREHLKTGLLNGTGTVLPSNKSVYDFLLTTDTAGTHDITTANDKVETDVVEISDTTRYGLSIYFDLNTLVAAVEGGTVTIKMYNKIDESTYREVGEATFIVGTTTTHPSFEVMRINHNVKFTIQCSTDVTATRQINYRYIKEPKE